MDLLAKVKPHHIPSPKVPAPSLALAARASASALSSAILSDCNRASSSLSRVSLPQSGSSLSLKNAVEVPVVPMTIFDGQQPGHMSNV
ncbi:hypothetical protein E2C01_031176 [Portunus trituberculatus]|uniref:Uncharacterized protein n=1 Tax=Portunus trituberculatus TaxID=210409 RepID=A0A5B7EWZ1_PORTR|nr:hypothetical protein [Portunus trituberculatus]